MTKDQLIDAVAQKIGGTKKDVSEMMEAVLDVITATLSKKEEVVLTGFGKFSVTHRAERMGINPKNPTEKIKIAASDAPKFKAGKSLKDAVR